MINKQKNLKPKPKEGFLFGLIRMGITFEDPKAFDNTPQQSEKYDERSVQIATEIFYVFSQIFI